MFVEEKTTTFFLTQGIETVKKDVAIFLLGIKKEEEMTYEDDSVEGQVTGVSKLLADGGESDELVLDGGGLDSILDMLNGLACLRVKR